MDEPYRVVVSDMERSLEFYRDLLGLEEERNQILEGEFISELVGYPDARLHIIYLGSGDMRHSVELIQYLNPPGTTVAMPERHQVGASHLGVIVDDLNAFTQSFRARAPVRKPAGDTTRSGIPHGQQGVLHAGPGRQLAGVAGASDAPTAPLRSDALRRISGPCAAASGTRRAPHPRTLTHSAGG